MTIRASTQIQSVDHAYQLLAQQILAFIDGRSWDEGGAKHEVTSNSVASSWWRKVRGEIDERGKHPPRHISHEANDAVFFLRNDLARVAGQLIWGLRFTLYPSGKFTIEYDYNKPEGYEETDETLDVSLTDFAAQINKK